MAAIETITREHKDEWVLVRVAKEDALGQPLEGEVIAHSKDRDEIYKAQEEVVGDLAIFYTGEIPKKGYAVAFHFHEKIPI